MGTKKTAIYTDGGCIGNPGPGGWAYVIVNNGQQIQQAGSNPETTNNKMELQAVCEALRYVHAHLKEEEITVHSDSRYVIQGISEWLAQWKRRDWKRANKKPVLNSDQWKELDALANSLSLTWQWVPGHADVHFNELCHQLVHQAIKEI